MRKFPIIMVILAGVGLFGLLIFPNLMLNTIELSQSESRSPFANEFPMYVVTKEKNHISGWQMEEGIWKDGHFYLVDKNHGLSRKKLPFIEMQMNPTKHYYELNGNKQLSIWFGNFDPLISDIKQDNYEVIIYNFKTGDTRKISLPASLDQLEPVNYVVDNQHLEIIFSGKTSQLNFWKEMELKKYSVTFDSKGNLSNPQITIMPDKVPTLIPKLG